MALSVKQRRVPLGRAQEADSLHAPVGTLTGVLRVAGRREAAMLFPIRLVSLANFIV